MTMIFPLQNYKSAKSGKYNQNSTSHGTWNRSMNLKSQRLSFALNLNDAIKT